MDSNRTLLEGPPAIQDRYDLAVPLSARIVSKRPIPRNGG